MKSKSKVVDARKYLGGAYLQVAAVTVALATLAQSLKGNEVFLRGQPLSSWIIILGSAIALVAFLLMPRNVPPLKKIKTLPILFLLGVWFYLVSRHVMEQSLFSINTFAFPLLLVMMWAKPPSYSESIRAAKVFCYSVIAIGAISIALDLTDLGPSAFQVARTGTGRIPILSDLLGIDTRWEGPYGHVNYAAPLGTAIVVISMACRGASRWLLLAGGILILTLTQGRNALVAAVIGLAIYWIYSTTRYSVRQKIRILVVILFLTGFTVILYVILKDPTMASRTPNWRDFVGLWRTNPVFGTGDSGVQEYLVDSARVGHRAEPHAHSIFLDGLSRWGIPMLVMMLGFFLSSFYLAHKIAKKHRPLAISLLAVTFIGGLAETTITFMYVSLDFFPLIIALAALNPRSVSGNRQNRIELSEASPSSSNAAANSTHSWRH